MILRERLKSIETLLEFTQINLDRGDVKEAYQMVGEALTEVRAAYDSEFPQKYSRETW